MSSDMIRRPKAPEGMMIGLSNVPLAVDPHQFAFSWTVRDMMQSAYRILVASRPEILHEGKGDVWDSGKIPSTQNTNVFYTGEALAPDCIYWWAVSVWNEGDEETPLSTPQFFSTAVGDRWQASAVWCGKSESAQAYEKDYYAAFGPADFTLECDYEIQAGKLDFLVHKRENNDRERHGYLFRIVPDKIRALRATEALDDTLLWLSSAPVSSGETGTHHLSIVAKGPQLTAFVDGVCLITLDNCFEYERGYFGIRCDEGDVAYVRNLVFTDTQKGSVVCHLQGLALQNGENFYYVDREHPHTHRPLPERNNIIFLRRPFILQSKPVKKALVNAVALSRKGILQYTFKLYINGKCMGLGSPRSMDDGKYTNLYSTFDVTDALQAGENVIGAISYAMFDRRFSLRLKIFYEDGTEEILNTDQRWRTHDGTHTYGEDGSTTTKYGSTDYAMADNLNALCYPYGWSEPGYDDTTWENAVIKENILGLQPSPLENMFEYTMPVREVVNKGNGNYLITLEKEIIGGLRLSLNVPEAHAGTCMTVLYGEELEEEGRVKWMMRTRNTYREFWTVKEGKQILESYGMKGFRYVEIRNCPIPLTEDMIEGVPYRQAFDRSDASFACSEPLLNDIFDLCKYAIEATNQDIYTDSQTRERADNDSGDTYVNVKTAHAVSRNYTLSRFTAHYMDGISHRISEYSIHAILSAWEFYRYTGDKTIIAEDYEHFKRLLRTDHIDPEKGLYWFQTDGSFLDLVDWPHYERDNYQIFDCYYNTVSNSYFYKGMCVVAEMADLLGKNEDAETYRTMAKALKKSINRSFYNINGDGLYIEGMKRDGTPVTGTAAPASLYPLLHGLVDDKDKVATLLAYVGKRGFTGSVFGAQFVLETLYAYEAGDRAYELLTDRGIRSWYHVLYELGATVTTEAWDPTHKANMTFSHPWGSAAGNAIMEGLCGITPLCAGFDQIQIKPQMGALTWITGSMPTVKGAVTVQIKRNTGDNATEMRVTIPGNTTATVYVPRNGSHALSATVDGQLRAPQKVTDQFLVYKNIGFGEHGFVIAKE